VKGIAIDLVEAANAADVTVENYRAVPPVDAHESSCIRRPKAARSFSMTSISFFASLPEYVLTAACMCIPPCFLLIFPDDLWSDTNDSRQWGSL
jgi:hypothetical protein